MFDINDIYIFYGNSSLIKKWIELINVQRFTFSFKCCNVVPFQRCFDRKAVFFEVCGTDVGCFWKQLIQF